MAAASSSSSFPFSSLTTSYEQAFITAPRGVRAAPLRSPILHASSSKPDADRNAKTKPISFGDRLLDYIEGGPKLRKWYGAQEQLVRDGGQKDYEEASTAEQILEDTDGVRDAVLVTDADTETGQLIVLSLILKRVRVRVLVKDAKFAISAFGSYIEPIVGDVADKASVVKALRGVRAIICPAKVGALAQNGVLRGVEHVIFLSQLVVLRNEKGIGSILAARARKQAEEDEAAVANFGVPTTIIRTGRLQDEPGGRLGFAFAQGSTLSGTLSREDAATVCVKALDVPPQQSLIFEVVNGSDTVSDWEDVFSSFEEGVGMS
ncbi:hypothetical protein O6H91_02G029700 [Diphasiastrum complanatum]|uniref:Uncharacterized protein n=1 Tax=Diphasiastrum complanatum TaxID=34168 RepID=A0ACC2EE78_DIPCM|nr:hypothetical protein O6H91_02G029700 [Diphasiastrum complanatum]